MHMLMLTNLKVEGEIPLMLSGEKGGWLSLTSDADVDADLPKSGTGDPVDALW